MIPCVVSDITGSVLSTDYLALSQIKQLGQKLIRYRSDILVGREVAK